MATSVRRENLLVNGNDINIFCRREMIHAPRDLSFELCRLKYYFKFIRLALNSSVCHEPVCYSCYSAELPNDMYIVHETENKSTFLVESL